MASVRDSLPIVLHIHINLASYVSLFIDNKLKKKFSLQFILSSLMKLSTLGECADYNYPYLFAHFTI